MITIIENIIEKTMILFDNRIERAENHIFDLSRFDRYLKIRLIEHFQSNITYINQIVCFYYHIRYLLK